MMRVVEFGGVEIIILPRILEKHCGYVAQFRLIEYGCGVDQDLKVSSVGSDEYNW